MSDWERADCWGPIVGATFVCELPKTLGAVTSMRGVNIRGADRFICTTESGVDFIVPEPPQERADEATD